MRNFKHPNWALFFCREFYDAILNLFHVLATLHLIASAENNHLRWAISKDDGKRGVSRWEYLNREHTWRFRDTNPSRDNRGRNGNRRSHCAYSLFETLDADGAS